MADDDRDQSTLNISATATQPPPLEIDAPPGTIDLAKERELRGLRARVQALTERLGKYERRIQPNLTTEERYEGKHGVATCGFHPQVIVSTTTSSVRCKVCGAELSPLDVLREYAREERQFAYALSELREEKQALSKEVAELKKQRSSLRSQVRKKGGEVPPSPNATRVTQAEYFKLLNKCERLQAELDARKERTS